MAEPPNSWLWRQRSATRLAFVLQAAFRVLSSLVALVWTSLLLGSMGDALYGLFLAYQAVASLGTLADLGIGGVISITTSRLLGQGKVEELRSILAAARAMFLVLALALTAVFVLLAPWLPGWLRFEQVPGAGSLTWLFVVGALGAGLLVWGGYFTNLNLGCANVTWPVVPSFLFLQLALLLHWLLARQHAPLWLQYLPYLLPTALGTLAGWAFVRMSHPPLAGLRPLLFERGRFLSLLEKSFWIYLYCLSSPVYSVIDRLLINAGFGAEQVTLYHSNFRLGELAMFVIVSASGVVTPKITQWWASPQAADRVRAIQATERVNRYQSLLGCGAALGYLAINDLFMTLWLGPDYRAPLAWQAAFAANLSVTAAGYVGLDMAARCTERGIRVGGIVVALSALLNLVLAFAAMKLGSILGIALAAVVAKSGALLVLGVYSYRNMGISWWRRAVWPWVLAALMAGSGYAVRRVLVPDSVGNMALVAGVFGLLLVLAALGLGIRLSDVREEWSNLRSTLK